MITLTWCPIGIKKEVEAANTTPITKERGSAPKRKAASIAIGVTKTVAAAFDITAPELDVLVSETQRVLDLLDMELNGAHQVELVSETSRNGMRILGE